MVVLQDSENNTSIVSNFVASLGVRAANAYSTTKEAAPEVVKSSVARLETIVSPYGEPVFLKLKEHGEPLLNVLDQTVATHVLPRAKAVEQGVQTAVEKSEDYLKASYQLAQTKVTDVKDVTNTLLQHQVDRVTETVKLAHTKVADVKDATENLLYQQVERVSETVKHVEARAKPYKESTHKAVTDLAGVALRNKDYVEKTARDTVEGLIDAADRAVDKVLPETAATAVPVKNPVKKMVYRIFDRVSNIASHSCERAKEIVHVDLISYAKEIIGADEAKIAAAFDNVISKLPSADTTHKYTQKVTSKLPKRVRPYVNRVASYTTPIVNASFTYVASFILFIRSFVLPVPASSTSAPNPTENDPVSSSDSSDVTPVKPTVADPIPSNAEQPSVPLESKSSTPPTNPVPVSSSEDSVEHVDLADGVPHGDSVSTKSKKKKSKKDESHVLA